MKALVIYDSFALASRANTLIQRAVERASYPFDCDISPWRTEMVKGTSTAEQIYNEACDAHLIVFAWRENRPFPSWLKHWLEKWAGARNVKDAAIALVGEGRSSHLMSILRELSDFTESRELCLIIDQKIVLEKDASPEISIYSQRTPADQIEDLPA